MTPRKPVGPAISVAGTRSKRMVVVSGTTTGFGAGGIVTPWVKKGGQGQVYREGHEVLVDSDGSFSWSRRVSGPVVWVYFSAGDTRSNEIRLGPPG